MSFLDDLRIEISSDADEEQSDFTLEKPRGRGIAKEWTLLHAFATVEEFMANYPSRDEFYARNKTALFVIFNARSDTASISFASREGIDENGEVFNTAIQKFKNLSWNFFDDFTYCTKRESRFSVDRQGIGNAPATSTHEIITASTPCS